MAGIANWTSLAAGVDVRGECENLVALVLSLVPDLAHVIAWLVGDTVMLGVDPVRLVHGLLGSADFVSQLTSQNVGVGDTRFRTWAPAGCAGCMSRTVTVSSRIDGQIVFGRDHAISPVAGRVEQVIHSFQRARRLNRGGSRMSTV